DYFAYEVSKINESGSELYESVPSFLKTRIDETLLSNNYSNAQDALRYLNSTLAYLSINNDLEEAYSGSTDDFVVQFLKRYGKISYCEFSGLLSEYFLAK
ncbi:MAG: hypothetical protein KC478_01625, partial [Bacteriovoracaceae bacterium]|nr:hypothetical protein [Bacteriovoracaceae bacterium]